MGRGKGKGKKLTSSIHEDPGSGEEEKIPTQKRRGRPLKSSKSEMEGGEEFLKTEGDDSENNSNPSTGTAADTSRKRRRNSLTEEKQSTVTEDRLGSTLVAEVSTKPSGFRHIGSRRKSKPRRAAEVGVECW